jgi:hypothetical protein
MRTMRVLKPWASFSCVVLALFAVTQFEMAANPAEPQQVEEGREAFGQACVQCHNMSRTQIQRKTADAWRDTVYSMISRVGHLWSGCNPSRCRRPGLSSGECTPGWARQSDFCGQLRHLSFHGSAPEHASV